MADNGPKMTVRAEDLLTLDQLEKVAASARSLGFPDGSTVQFDALHSGVSITWWLSKVGPS